MVRLRDVTMAGEGRGAQGGSDVGASNRDAVRRSDECGTDTDNSDSKFVKFGSNWGYAGSVAIDGDTMEEILVMASGGLGDTRWGRGGMSRR